MTTGDFEPQPGQYPQTGALRPARADPAGPYGQPGGYPRHPAVRDQAGSACGSSRD